MAVNYFPFDSLSVDNPDRAADSSQFAAYMATFISDGVIVSGKYALNQLQVKQTESASMQITVDKGSVIIGGRRYFQDAIRTLTVQAADASLDRIDRVVARLNLNQEYRNIDLYILKGDATSNPAPPALTRNNIIYEMCLAELYVPANVTTITGERITDTRLNSEICGSAYCLVGEVDTTAIYDKLEKAYNDFVQGLVADFSVTYAKLASGLVVNNLTTNIAGYLADARMGKTLNDLLNTHKSSSDHDSRYYTETEVNNLLNAKANATEFNAIKMFISAKAYANGILENALNVDTSNAEGDLNKPRKVRTTITTIGLPADCFLGVREVYYYSNTNITIKITGWNTGSYIDEWFNFYNGSAWTGWVSEITKRKSLIETGADGVTRVTADVQVESTNKARNAYIPHKASKFVATSSDEFGGDAGGAYVKARSGGQVTTYGTQVVCASYDGSHNVPIAASAFNVGSSKLIKENIEDMSEEEANKILGINIVGFDYKEKFGGVKGNFGVIAEPTKEIIPSAVTVPDGYSEENFVESEGINQKILSVDYSKFIPYLIKKVQMQQKEIEALKRN